MILDLIIFTSRLTKAQMEIYAFLNHTSVAPKFQMINSKAKGVPQS